MAIDYDFVALIMFDLINNLTNKMKNTKLIATALIISLYFVTFGQISHGGIPPSLKYGGHIVTESFPVEADWNTIKAEDAYTLANQFPLRIGLNIPVNKGLNDIGAWSQLPDGRMLWRYEIELAGAKALSVMFDKFKLPKGAELYLYDANRHVTIGAFTSENNNKYNIFNAQMLPGDRVVIEYCEIPNGIAEINNYRSITDLNIGEVIYVYNDGGRYDYLLPEGSKPSTGASQWCMVNVNCPEGDDWQVHKKGVVALVMPLDGKTYLCSGSMVNDAINSGTQYLLTAFHCGDGTQPEDKLRWQFYYNYERPSCSNDERPEEGQMISGCELVSESGVMRSGSDYMLVRLIDRPMSDWNIYYNGWDISEVPSNSGVGIHHPNGDVKKISTYTTPLKIGTFNTSMTNGFWSVKWAETESGRSLVEGGSSGSPLFNTEGLIVGTLTGGNANCTDNPDGSTLYGRIDKHWTANGTTMVRQLKPWLDPLNTGITKVDGVDPKKFVVTEPKTDFFTTSQTVAAYSEVEFCDATSNMPDGWEWTFEGATPNSSTDRNPKVFYETPGIYTVTLKSKNSVGKDEITKTGYITVTHYKGDDVIIGTGTEEGIYPLGSAAKYERSASIYRKNDIGSAGAITSLGWFTNAAKREKNITIYLKHTTASVFSISGDTWEQLISDAQLVFDGKVSTSNRDWTDVGLSSVFQYNGESNIMVLVEQNNSANGNTKCQYSLRTASSQVWSNNNEAPTGVGKRSADIPNIKIGIFNRNLTPSVTINNKVVAFDGNVHKGDIVVTPETMVYADKYRKNGTTEWVDAVSAIGDYDVQVIVEGNEEYNELEMVREKALMIVREISVDEAQLMSKVRIYPNPAKNHITIDGENIASIAIYDLMGREQALFHNSGSLDISKLCNGVYTTVITSVTGERRVDKIMIVR